MTKQQLQLKRVSGNIADFVLEFFHSHAPADMFFSEDVTLYVRARAVCSPSSVDRVMRDLRAKDVIRYKCVNRQSSLYEIQ